MVQCHMPHFPPLEIDVNIIVIWHVHGMVLEVKHPDGVSVVAKADILTDGPPAGGSLMESVQCICKTTNKCTMIAVSQ